MKKLIIIIFLSSLISLHANDFSKYNAKSFDEMLNYAIDISTEHITEKDYEELTRHHTYFKDTYFIANLTWNDTNKVYRVSDAAYDEIEAALRQLGRPEETFKNYKNFAPFNYKEKSL